MKTTAVVIAVLVAGAFLLQLYLPTSVGISYQASAGVEQAVPVNVFAFWLLIIVATVVAIVCVFRRVIA